MKLLPISITVAALVASAAIMLTLNRETAPEDLKEFNKQQAAKPIAQIKTKPVATASAPAVVKYVSFIHIDKSDLVADITSNYHNTPTRAKTELLDTIMEVSAQYDINPLILYAIGYVESSMNPYTVHREAIIDIGGKKLKVQAKGAYGIVWEWWGQKLIEAKILTNKADLFDPILATQALGFIYNELRAMPMHQSASNKDESALLRYFGGDYKSYLDKIDDKIGSLIASKLYKSK